MQIIKDKQLADNSWTFANDEAEISPAGDITVSFQRWLKDKALFSKRSGKTGLRIGPTDPLLELSGKLDGIELIELDFPRFGDGRMFSQASLLRSRLGYQGEIRAIGLFLTDQVNYLWRLGVNAFQFTDQQQIPLALSAIDEFSVDYQSALTR